MGSREGQVALVTGASSGLGRAVAVALAGVGADVTLVARSEEDLQRVEEEASRTGRKTLVLSAVLRTWMRLRG